MIYTNTSEYKRYHANERNIPFNLSFEDYLSLIIEADITESDIGWGASKYCLGRYGDDGPYQIGNCRFITNRENGIEGTETRKRRGDGNPGGVNLIGENHWNHKGFVVTPWGKFESLRKAANDPNALFGHTKIMKMIKSDDPTFYYG